VHYSAASGMKRIAIALRGLRRWTKHHRVQLALCLRATAAAVSTLVLAQILQLPLLLWPVLTAVILTQASFGRSLKVTIEYLTGTLSGAIYAGVVGALIPHTNGFALAAVLAISVAPAALLAALKPAFSVAPFTAVLVILAPAITHMSPTESAVYRVFEVLLGGTTALAASLLVFPARAHDLAVEAAANLLNILARAFRKVLLAFIGGVEAAAIDSVQDSISESFRQLAAIAAEAKSERMTYLRWGPDPERLLRTLLRLRYDLVIIGQAAVEPLPETLRAALGPVLIRVAETAANYLGEGGIALLVRREPPPLSPVERALDDFAVRIGAIRQEGLTRDLPNEVVERIFALGFALQQLRKNFRDLRRCLGEYADTGTDHLV
jgi:uncharacterized membrane protein YccC